MVRPRLLEAVCTRYYDGHLTTTFEPAIVQKPVDPGPLREALTAFAAGARRLPASAADQEEATQKLRTELATWAVSWQEKLNPIADLRATPAVALLSANHAPRIRGARESDKPLTWSRRCKRFLPRPWPRHRNLRRRSKLKN